MTISNLIKATNEAATKRAPKINPAADYRRRGRTASKGFNDKSLKIARELSIRAEASLTAFCSITGLPVDCDLPPMAGYGLATVHPLAFNCRAMLDHPEYIAKLNNAHLAGLIIGLLVEADKISIKSNSNPFFTRAKLEVVASRNKLLDIIEWIANSLLVTQLYYPKLVTGHNELTLDSIQEWMEWTYSIEVYSFAGSKLTPAEALGAVERATKVKAPKRLKIEATEIRRLGRQFDSSVNELAAALLLSEQDVIPSKVANNISFILKGKASTASSKIDNLLATIATIEELVDIAQDLIDYREAAAKAVASNATELDDLLDAVLEATPEATAPVESPIAETVEAVEEASIENPIAGNARVEAPAPESVEEPKLTFKEKLALAKLSATKESK